MLEIKDSAVLGDFKNNLIHVNSEYRGGYLTLDIKFIPKVLFLPNKFKSFNKLENYINTFKKETNLNVECMMVDKDSVTSFIENRCNTKILCDTFIDGCSTCDICTKIFYNTSNSIDNVSLYIAIETNIISDTLPFKFMDLLFGKHDSILLTIIEVPLDIDLKRKLTNTKITFAKTKGSFSFDYIYRIFRKYNTRLMFEHSINITPGKEL